MITPRRKSRGGLERRAAPLPIAPAAQIISGLVPTRKFGYHIKVISVTLPPGSGSRKLRDCVAATRSAFLPPPLRILW
jgi:hypothetical protein